MKPAKSYLPLPHLWFHVLMALAGEDRHGYAIIKDISAGTEGALRPATGTLYTAIQRLLDEGLIAPSAWRPENPDEDDRRRRYYRLTERGREVASAEARRLDRALALARKRRLLTDSG